MILKVVRGDYFQGLVNYIMRRGQYAEKGDTARVIRCSGLYNPVTAAAQLCMQASRAPDRTKRAVHFIGRAERLLSDKEYVQTAEAGLAAMGLAGRPYLLVVHEEDGGFHCATVEVDEQGAPPPRRLWSNSLQREVSATEANELDAGDVASRSWDSHLAWRLTKLARGLEIEFGLQELGGKKDSYDEIRIPDWQLRREASDGLAPLQEILGDEIKFALGLKTWDERADALAVHGLGLRLYAGSNGKRKGLQIYALSDATHFCNGSSLGKKYGLGALEKATEQSLEEWIATRENLSDRQARFTPKVEAGPFTRDEASDLKREFDCLVSKHSGARSNGAAMAARHQARIAKIKRIVLLLREKLLGTGMVSKAWAQTVCSIVRAQMHTKALRARAKERATAKAKRAPTWLQFLKDKAPSHAIAAALYEGLRKKRHVRSDGPLVDEPFEPATPLSQAQAQDGAPSPSRNEFAETKAEEGVPIGQEATKSNCDDQPQLALSTPWSIHETQICNATVLGEVGRPEAPPAEPAEALTKPSTMLADANFRRPATEKLATRGQSTTPLTKTLKAAVSKRQTSMATQPAAQTNEEPIPILEGVKAENHMSENEQRREARGERLSDHVTPRTKPVCVEAASPPEPKHPPQQQNSMGGRGSPQMAVTADRLFAQGRSLKEKMPSGGSRPLDLPSHGPKSRAVEDHHAAVRPGRNSNQGR